MAGLKPEPREGIWYAVGTFNGKRIRKSLSTRDEKTAKELCAVYEAKLWKRHTYGEDAVRTFEEAALSYQMQGGERRFLEPILKHFRGKPLRDITPGEIRQMALTLYPNTSPATRNRQAIVPARAVIRHGHSMGWCSPISVEIFPVPKPRKHNPVSRKWMAAFLAESDKSKLPHLSALVLFMNQTGARVGEAVELLGEDVNIAARTAVLRKTKTDEDSVRHLTTELIARIAALGLREGERVFSYTDPKAVNRRMASVCGRAKIARRSTHSAGRHSFATNAMAAGAKVKDAMDAGGWKTAKQFMETYVHSHEAGKTVADMFDKETGPIDANLPQAIKRKKNRFGKTRP